MTVQKNPNQALPTAPPVTSKEWTPTAEIQTYEWPLGAKEDVDSLYNTYTAVASGGGGIASISMRKDKGRGSLIVSFGPTSAEGDGLSGIQTIEELYSIDILKDIRTAPYFDDLADEAIAFVGRVAEDRLTQVEIDAIVEDEGLSSSLEYGSWLPLMDQLYYHIIHGVDSYYETAFILRRSKSGVRSSFIRGGFTDINRVVTAPTLSVQMNSLIAALPAGEWLKKPTSAEYLGKGRWRVDEEWQWAVKWSVVYGGTWGYTAP